MNDALKQAERRLYYLRRRKALAEGKAIEKRKPSTSKYAQQDKDYHFYRFWAKEKGLTELALAWERKRKNMVYYNHIFVDFQTRMIDTFGKHGSNTEKAFVANLLHTDDKMYKIS